MEAIAIDNHEIIKILIKCGAHMTGSARALSENLCVAAARGFVKRLQSYRLAGANLSQGDFSGRTALHAACLHNQKEVLEYLLKNSVDTTVTDHLKMRPQDYALNAGHTEIINILAEWSGVKNGDCMGIPPSSHNNHTKKIE